MGKIKAVFFDRDGTLIKDVGYLSDLKKIQILPKIVSLCSFLQDAGCKLFVVTNQSGIARGFFDEDFVKKSHEHLQKIFKKKGVFFEKFYYCPHHPYHAIKPKYLRSCFCRKPMPGMIFKACKQFNIDPQKSLMFGDKLTDIQVGLVAGCKSFFIQDFLSNENSINFFNKETLEAIKDVGKGKDLIESEIF